MMVRVRFLFTHKETGKTYLTKGYYEDEKEAAGAEVTDLDSALPDGKFDAIAYPPDIYR